jgi:MSHA pilin protein MshD
VTATRHKGQPRREAGFTLIELVMALVVVGVAITGVMLAFQTVVRKSSDPVIVQQLISVAETITEEAALLPYVPQTNVTTSSGCARDGFNDVSDFHNYATSSICAADGTVLTSLSGYSVSVQVTSITVSGVAMKLITVVSSKGADSFTLRTLKADLS